MERRDALKHLVAGLGAATTPAWVATLTNTARAHAATARAQSGPTWKPKVFTAHQNETIVTLTELIIPETDTAGAKATEVNVFIDTVLDDAHDAEREEFLRGLTWGGRSQPRAIWHQFHRCRGERTNRSAHHHQLRRQPISA